MKKEADRPMPNMEIAKELMCWTYQKQRRWILKEEQPVSDDYLFYKMPSIVSFIICTK